MDMGGRRGSAVCDQGMAYATATKNGGPASVVAFILRNSSSRRERREMRSAASAAAFRARLRAGFGIAEARAAGANYASDFSASAEVAPFANSEIYQKAVLEPEETAARHVLAEMEPRDGARLNVCFRAAVWSSSRRAKYWARMIGLSLLSATSAPLLCQPRQYRCRRTSSRRTWRIVRRPRRSSPAEGRASFR